MSSSADWYSAVFSCRSRILNSVSPETVCGRVKCVTGFPLPGSLCCKERDGIGRGGKSSPSRTGLFLDVDLNLGGFLGRLPVGPSVSFKLGTLGTRADLGSVAG